MNDAEARRSGTGNPGDRDRIVVIGLDAADPDFLERMCEERRVPFLASVAERGARGRLASTYGLFSDSPWPSLTSLEHRTAFVRAVARDAGGAFLTDATRLRHANPDRLGAMLATRYRSGRLSAAARAKREGWGKPRRTLAALATPVGAARRLLRTTPLLLGPGRVHDPRPATVLAVAAALAADAVGRTLGHLAGPGDAALRYREAHERLARERAPGAATAGDRSPRLAVPEGRTT